MAFFQYNSCVVDLTPEFPIKLSGSTDRSEVSEGIDDPIEANIIYLSSQSDAVLIVSVDVLFVSVKSRNYLIEQLNSRSEIKLAPRQVVFIATHTHYSSTLDDRDTPVNIVDPYFIEVSLNKIVEQVVEMFKTPCREVSLCYKEQAIDLTINRRKRIMFFNRRLAPQFETVIAPNPFGVKGKTVKLIEIKDAKSQTIGYLWNMACHPNNYFNRKKITAHFIGTVRRFLSKQQGKKIPVVFLQGFAGNIRLNESDTPFIDKFKVLLGLRLRFKHFTFDSYKRWSQKLTSQIQSLLDSKPLPLKGQEISCKLIAAPFEQLAIKQEGNKSDNSFDVDFQRVDISDDFSIIAVSAEPVIEYEAILQKLIGEKKFFSCGYINSVHCYLPTDKMVSEGGYEVESFVPLFGLKGKIQKGVEAFVVNMFKEVLR